MRERREVQPGAYTLLDVYQQMIIPKLKEIDLLLKTTEGSISVSQTAEILEISTEEVYRIMTKHQFEIIDPRTFVRIMERGSSPICRLFHREVVRGSPFVYSRQDIAYIYNVDIEQVNQICDFLHIREITPYTLPQVFAFIYVL